VDGNGSDGAGVGRVVVNQLMRACIPNFDCVVGRAGGDAPPVGEEQGLVDHVDVIVESVKLAVRGDVPQLDQLVIAARDGCRSVGGKLSGADPVCVPHEGADELARRQRPDFGGFVVGARDEVPGVGRESHGAHGPGVPFQRHGIALAVVREKEGEKERVCVCLWRVSMLYRKGRGGRAREDVR